MTPTTRIRTRLTVLMCAVLALASVTPERPRTAAPEPIVTAAPNVDRSPGAERDTPALPAGVGADWWTAVRAQIETDAYAVRPVTGTAPGIYEADNPRQGWRTRFTSAGLAIAPAEPPARDALEIGVTQGRRPMPGHPRRTHRGPTPFGCRRT